MVWGKGTYFFSEFGGKKLNNSMAHLGFNLRNVVPLIFFFILNGLVFEAAAVDKCFPCLRIHLETAALATQLYIPQQLLKNSPFHGSWLPKSFAVLFFISTITCKYDFLP